MFSTVTGAQERDTPVENALRRFKNMLFPHHDKLGSGKCFIYMPNQIINRKQTHNLCLGKLTLSDPKKKFEPEPGFEPRTSGFLARRSTT